jgi:hypothetical protein
MFKSFYLRSHWEKVVYFVKVDFSLGVCKSTMKKYKILKGVDSSVSQLIFDHPIRGDEISELLYFVQRYHLT